MNYEDGERKILREMGCESLLELIDGKHLTTLDALRMAADRAFLEDLKGPAVEALRRALTCINKGIYRETQEYSSAIQFDSGKTRARLTAVGEVFPRNDGHGQYYRFVLPTRDYNFGESREIFVDPDEIKLLED